MLGWPGRGRGLAGHTEWGRAPSFSQGRELGAPLGGRTSLQKQCTLHVHGAFSFLKTLFIFSRHPPWSSERLGRDGGGQRPGSAGTWARPGAGLQAPREAPTDGIWAVGWGGASLFQPGSRQGPRPLCGLSVHQPRGARGAHTSDLAWTRGLAVGAGTPDSSCWLSLPGPLRSPRGPEPESPPSVPRAT